MNLLEKLITQPYWYLIIFIPYFCGAFPSGYLLAKIFKKTDITKLGSGSIGMTNVTRTIGKTAGLLTLLLDLLKTILAFELIKLIIATNTIFWLQLAAILVIVGHTKNIFLLFKGGKGVASSFAIWLYFSIPAFFITSLLWLAIFKFKKL